MKKIFNNQIFLSLLTNGGAAVFGFLTFMILSRAFAPSEFGTWLYFVVILNILEIFRSGLLQISLIRYKAGVQNETESQVVGSAWFLAIAVSLLLLFIIGTGGYLMTVTSTLTTYSSFPFWLSVIFVLGLPYNFTLLLFQAEGAFFRLMVVRFFAQGCFFLYVTVVFILDINRLDDLFLAYATVQLAASLICLLFKWTGLRSVINADRVMMKEMLNYGKYNLGTVLVSNLLRSSDSFIIGLAMSPTAVALYSVPFKLIELVEMPLRSVVSVFMPKMAALISKGTLKEQKKFYLAHSGMLTVLVLPVVLIIFFLAEPLVQLIGGSQYLASAVLLKILIFYALFLPLDRLSGVALDLYGYPRQNFFKVLIMLSVNVGGDLLAIYLFNDLRAVAVVSLLTFFAGLWYGNYHLRKKLNYRVSQSFVSAYETIRSKLTACTV